jgi:glycosyltransferase involved in cell wall biosynthesis
VRPDDSDRARARAELGIGVDQRVALYVGSLSPEKNVGLAIDAVSSLPEVQLLVIGDGPERGRLERLAQDRRADVRFLGSMLDPTVGLTAADALVLPSRTEGMSGVLLEAAMCGLPAVVTDVGAAREVVVDGRSGVVVPPDDEHAFADGMRSVLSSASTYAVDRDDLVKRFDIQLVADSWSQLIERAASEGRP